MAVSGTVRNGVGVTAQITEVANRVIERASPLRLGEIERPGDLAAALRLRRAAVIEQGWGEETDFPTGMERDEFDDDAVHLGAWDGHRLVATARLVFPAQGRPLPTEETFGISVQPAGHVVDLGRLVVDRAYRGGNRGVLLAILGKSWLSILERGFEHFCGVDAPGMIRLYRRLGFVVEELAPARDYWGEERFPVRFDLPRAAQRLSELWG